MKKVQRVPSSFVNRGLLLTLTILWATLLVPAANSQKPNPTITAIQEETFVTLGGIEQWITIRGGDRGNPVLLVIHGGPGDAQSFLRDTYAVYENDFTIVQWESAWRREDLRKES